MEMASGFSLDFSPMFDYAAQLLSSLSPVIEIVGGVLFGVMVVTTVLVFVLGFNDQRRKPWHWW
jgi:hypothetical protein